MIPYGPMEIRLLGEGRLFLCRAGRSGWNGKNKRLKDPKSVL